MFESLKEIRRQRQQELDNLANYNVSQTTISLANVFIKIFSVLVILAILIFPIMLLGQCGWVIVVFYIVLFIPIVAVSFIAYEWIQKLSLKAFTKIVKTNNFDIKLLIIGGFSAIFLLVLCELWTFCHFFI